MKKGDKKKLDEIDVMEDINFKENQEKMREQRKQYIVVKKSKIKKALWILFIITLFIALWTSISITNAKAIDKCSENNDRDYCIERLG